VAQVARKPDARHFGDWRQKFIEVLREIPNPSEAARRAGVSRGHAYRVKGTDEEFAQAWLAALEEGVDKAEREAWRRGVEGVPRPVYGNMGEDDKGRKLGTGIVGITPEFSDRMLELLLKAHRPDKFRERYSVEDDRQASVDERILAVAKNIEQLVREGKGLPSSEILETEVGPDGVAEVRTDDDQDI
jgi:hypothetical protein